MVSRVSQVTIRNYKSIAQASVQLGPFQVFVGPNGAGKSNFIDALAFVQESLSQSLELAFKSRGGISAVRRRSGGHPTHIGIRLALEMKDISADYAFEIAAKPTERFTIARERCAVKHLLGREHRFEVRDGHFVDPIPGIRPRMSPDRLALFAASATDEFRSIYDFLTSMRFYSIVPSEVRKLQDPDPGESLKRDGSNAAAVLKRLQEDSSNGAYERVCRLLSKVVEGVRKVDYRSVGQKETLQFRQDVGLRDAWTFDALNMSDGTLRVLGVLLAAYQPGFHSVIGIEEPESTVHPAVAEVIINVLLDASRERQVLLTTHSPDILDHKELKDKHLRVVRMDQGKTIISDLSESSRDAIRNRLYTPGELLRIGELRPARLAADDEASQLQIFGPPFLKEGQRE